MNKGRKRLRENETSEHEYSCVCVCVMLSRGVCAAPGLLSVVSEVAENTHTGYSFSLERDAQLYFD